MTTSAAPIGWFEIAGSDLAKTEAFYASLFNWSFSADENIPGYRIMDGGDGISGGVTTAQAGGPANYAIFSVMVPDVAAACKQIVDLGGKVVVGPEKLAETGLVFANAQDIDGNNFGVFSPPTA